MRHPKEKDLILVSYNSLHDVIYLDRIDSNYFVGAYDRCMFIDSERQHDLGVPKRFMISKLTYDVSNIQLIAENLEYNFEYLLENFNLEVLKKTSPDLFV